jgi:tetratricopeptide (TPR) repeat protein
MFIIITALYLLFHIIPIFSNSHYFWGVDSFSYLPVFVTILLLCLIILSYFKQDSIEKSIKNFIEKIERKPIIFFVIASISLCLIFYLFRQKLFFLGDGYLRIRNLEAGMKFSAVEPLDTFIHSISYRFLNSLLGFSSADTYGLISIISGLICFIVCVYYIKLIFESRKERWFIGGILFTSGSIQLFFGYVESYSIIACLNLLLLLSTLNMIKNNKYSLVPAIFLSFSITTHPISIIFAPALFYGYFVVIMNSDRRTSLIIWIKPFISFIIIILISFGCFYLAGFTLKNFLGSISGDTHFLPLFSNKWQLGIISFEHFIDIMNEILLIAPSIIVLPIILPKIRKNLSPQIIFLLISIFFSFLFMLVFRTDLGFSRDWDIFSLCAFPLSLFIGLQILSIYGDVRFEIRDLRQNTEERTKNSQLWKYGYPIILVGLIHTGTWIYLNSNEEMSLKRAENLVQTPYWGNHSKAILYDELAHYYFNKGDISNSLTLTYKAWQSEKKNAYYYSLGVINYKLGKLDTALVIYQNLVKDSFKLANLYQFIGEIYYGKTKFKESADAFSNLVKITPSNANAWVNLGVSYFNLNIKDSAYKCFNEALKYDTQNQFALHYLGQIYSDSGNLDEAIKTYLFLLSLVPNNPEDQYNLALCYADKGDFKSALHHIEFARQYGFDQNMLNQLKTEIVRNIR